MSTIKVEVVWSPAHIDRFVTFGNDLRLYQVDTIKGLRTSGSILLSETTSAHLLAINSDVQFVKCISCFPKSLPQRSGSESDVLLAVGQTSGKVVLTSFNQGGAGAATLAGREFVPKHARQCNCVAWNNVDQNLLGVGLDKHRADYATFVWDVNRGLKPYVRDTGYSSNLSTSFSTPRSLYELGMGEITHSIKWFPQHPKVLVCGMNNKHLKIYDLRDRDTTKPKNQTITKAVHGISMDPYNDYRLASFTENQIVVWDHRNFEKPLTTLPEPKSIVKIAWCPTRSNMLASLVKDSNGITLYDIQQPVGNDDNEPVVVFRVVKPSSSTNNYSSGHTSAISSFDWHPSHESRMISVTTAAMISDYTVVDRITFNWSPACEIIWTHGKRLLQSIDSKSETYEKINDISVKMRKRALQGYGLSSDKLWQVSPEDTQLRNLWVWIELNKTLESSGVLTKSTATNPSDNLSSTSVKLQGVRSILISGGQNYSYGGLGNSSEVHYASFIGIESHSAVQHKVSIYKSDDRNKALLLCGWAPDIEDSNGSGIIDVIEKLESSGDWTRAACIAVFTLRIKKAIDTLTKGATTPKDLGGDTNLSAVAMALSGFAPEKSSLWREMCHTLRNQLTDPYLKAMFSFLTCDNDNYAEIMNESGLAVADRVAFACIYLSDHMLYDYLNNLTASKIAEGNLSGIILTGVSNNEGLDLLQRYIDLYGDVQTVSMILLHALPNSISLDHRATLWVDSYRNLLDCWRLWHQRAHFDIEWYRNLSGQQVPPQQIFVHCNYCGHGISSYLRHSSGNRSLQQHQSLQQALQQQQQYSRSISAISASTNKTRIQSCPGCRKPLPRCALCLTQLGTPAGSYWRHDLVNPIYINEQKVTPFQSWFSWCQSCRHGGHASHLIDWFKEHVECPVSGCNCKCMSLDSCVSTYET